MSSEVSLMFKNKVKTTEIFRLGYLDGGIAGSRVCKNTDWPETLFLEIVAISAFVKDSFSRDDLIQIRYHHPLLALNEINKKLMAPGKKFENWLNQLIISACQEAHFLPLALSNSQGKDPQALIRTALRTL
jgi:hypothetical protein